MFVGCSEISTSVIVKHVPHVGIIRAFCLFFGDLLSFSVTGRQEKLLGCGLGGISTQADTMGFKENSILNDSNVKVKRGCFFKVPFYFTVCSKFYFR